MGKEESGLRKILIVEDDKVLNKTLAYNLTADGYEVTSAYSFQDAVERLKKSEFDIALLDINLPDGNGLHLCDEIRGRGQHTYIMFITANDKEGDMLKGYEAGCTDYITKPFSVMVLCKKVAAVFANMELRTPKHDVFEDEILKIDFSEQSAVLEGKVIEFTPKEYRTAESGFTYNMYSEKAKGLNVVKYGAVEVKYMVRTTILSLKELVSGKLGMKDLSGPVGIVDAIGTTYEESKSEGTMILWMNMLNLAVLLSANLGVMNLLPFPALDGGRLVFLVIEAIRRKPINRQVEGGIHFAGLMLLMALMVFVMYNDIVKLI